VLELSGLDGFFGATVSSEEVEHGKPSPDVYLEAVRRLGVCPEQAAALEDSHNGILAAKAAGMRVVFILIRRYPPREDALTGADVVLEDISELTSDAVEGKD